MKHDHSYTYQTGTTEPPKSHQGLIAVLLILVILLTGAVSVLSLMNIHLFQMQKKTPSVQFTPESGNAPAVARELSAELTAADLGFSVHEVPRLYRSYQEWPQGVYICSVEEQAQKAGIQTGDILIAVEGTAVSGLESFEAVMANLTPGKTVSLTLFREGQELMVSVTAKGA